ncbi:MAG TPA: homoserine dehydrogenase [Candidatus Tripitaka californicus]|uniref:homoserine dehydrogenase n=1 Tax=Candidatus Tripitaka californicus TaxID=3367616 RepID=UPI00402A42B4
MVNKVIKIGLLGSGTVGKGVQDILFQDAQELEKRLGLRLEIEKIYTRSPQKKPWFSRLPHKFTTDPNEVIRNPAISIVIEVLGLKRREETRNIANYIVDALKSGKSVVTANKAVLASYGEEIHRAAVEASRDLRFEAAVAGGIPIIRSLGEGLLPDHVNQLYGILNGTCNYILSSISDQGWQGHSRQNMTFESALKEAQRLGYAETDPTADIKGHDTRDKLVVLLQLLYGLFVKEEEVATEGIDCLERVDFDYARQKLHSNIKLLGYVRRRDKEVVARVSPIMMKGGHILARVDGALNAILVDSQYCETMCFVGKGAGEKPTANSVVSDVISIAMGHHTQQRPIGFQFNELLEEKDENKYYIRFVVKDRPGIVSEILGYLRDNEVNVDEVLQLKHSQEEKAYFQKKFGFKGAVDEILPFILTVEPCREAAVRKAIEEIRRQDFLLTGPVVIKMLPNLPDVMTHQNNL